MIKIKKISLEYMSKENGWTKRFVASEPRLSEAVEAYQEAGYEIRLEPLPSQNECESDRDDGVMRRCRKCFDGCEDKYKIIYTRPQKPPL